jgi:hypothetical protein
MPPRLCGALYDVVGLSLPWLYPPRYRYASLSSLMLRRWVLHFVVSSGASSYDHIGLARFANPSLCRTHLLRVEPVSSLSNPYRRTRLNQPPASLNPRSSLLSSPPSGCLALVIAGRLESPLLGWIRHPGFVLPRLGWIRRGRVGSEVVGLCSLSSANRRVRLVCRCVRLGHASPRPPPPPPRVVSSSSSSSSPCRVVSSSSSSSSCRLFLFFSFLLLLLLLRRLVSCRLPALSPHFPLSSLLWSPVPPPHREPPPYARAQEVGVAFIHPRRAIQRVGVFQAAWLRTRVRHRKPPSSSSSRTSTLPPPHRELIPFLLVVGSR